MADLPFRFEDLPGEMRIAVFDQLSFPGVDQPRYNDYEFIGQTIQEWVWKNDQQMIMNQDFYRIHADFSESQVIPDKGFYTEEIIKLGRDFGVELDHRIHARWFAPVTWEAECIAVSTITKEYEMGGCNAYLRWNKIPRTFDTSPRCVCLTVRPFMDEWLMDMEWDDLDDETSDLSAEIVDAHCEMILEVGMQLMENGPSMTDWTAPLMGQGGDGFPQLQLTIQAFTMKVPEGIDAEEEGASIYSRETLIKSVEKLPDGTRYYPVPAKTVDRIVKDVCQYVDEGSGSFHFALNDTLITERDEAERPVFEVPEGEYIYKYECIYHLHP